MTKLATSLCSSFLSSMMMSLKHKFVIQQNQFESYFWYIMCLWNSTIIITIIIINITNSNIFLKTISIDSKNKDDDIHAIEKQHQGFLVLNHVNDLSSSSLSSLSFWLSLCISSLIPLIHSSIVLLILDKKKWVNKEKDDDDDVDGTCKDSFDNGDNGHEQHLQYKIKHHEQQTEDDVSINKDNAIVSSSLSSFSSLWRNNNNNDDEEGIIMSIVLLPTLIQSFILYRLLLLATTKNQNLYNAPTTTNDYFDIIYYSISFSIGQLIIIMNARSTKWKKNRQNYYYNNRNNNKNDDNQRKMMSSSNKNNSNSIKENNSNVGDQWMMKQQIKIIQWILPPLLLLFVRYVTISYYPHEAIIATINMKIMFKYVFCYCILLFFLYHSITTNNSMKSFHGVFTSGEYIVMIGIIAMIVIEYLFMMPLLYRTKQQQSGNNNRTNDISLSTWVSLSGLIGCCIACYCTPWLLSFFTLIKKTNKTTTMTPKNKNTTADRFFFTSDDKEKNEIKLNTKKKNESSSLSSSYVTMMIGCIKLLIIIIITFTIVEIQFQYYHHRMSISRIMKNTTTTMAIVNDNIFDNNAIVSTHDTAHGKRALFDTDTKNKTRKVDDDTKYSHLRRSCIGWLFNDFLYQSAIENNDNNRYSCHNNISDGSSINNSNIVSNTISAQSMLYQWIKQQTRYIWLSYWAVVLLLTIPMLFILQAGNEICTSSKTVNSNDKTVTKTTSISSNNEDWIRQEQQQQKDKQVILMDRKWFHLIAIVIFIPPTIYASQLLSLCYAIGLTLLIVFEMIRHDIILLNQFYSQYLDCHNKNEQSNTIIISHIGLVVGCAIPSWISRYLKDVNVDNHCLSINNLSFHLLLSCWGIICIGVGDAMGAVIGIRYGHIHWSKHNRRTVEGSLAMFLSMCLCCYLVTSSIIVWLPAVVFVTLLEAWTKQIDNFVLPLAGVTILLLTNNTMQLWSIVMMIQ